MDRNLINPDIPVFTIGVVAEHLKVHQRTLRIYGEEKILCPKRANGQRRLYSFNDIKKGEFIRYLTRNLGLNPAGIRITLELLEKLQISSDSYMDIINEIVAAQLVPDQTSI